LEAKILGKNAAENRLNGIKTVLLSVLFLTVFSVGLTPSLA
jgi:hypothetical protein